MRTKNNHELKVVVKTPITKEQAKVLIENMCKTLTETLSN